jgi:translation initiation factor 4G
MNQWVFNRVRRLPLTNRGIKQAAKEKQAQEKDAYMRQNASMSRGGSRRGGNRDTAEVSHPDGWSVAGSGAPPRQQPPKAGDLSQFGKISKTTPISFGPASVFSGKKGTDPKSRDPPMSRTPSTSSNMFSMLQSTDIVVDPPTSKSSRPPSRKPSVDLASGVPSDPAPQRRRLQLLPRSKPLGEESKGSTPAVSEDGSDDEAAEESGALTPAISEAEAKAKIEEDTKEFFGIRMLDEAESYFSSLPTEHRYWLVDTLVMKSIEMKEPDVTLVGDLFVRVREKDLCSPGVFEDGFSRLAEALDDLAVDIPKAWPYFAILLRGSGLDQDEERRRRIAEKTLDPDKLNRLL